MKAGCGCLPWLPATGRDTCCCPDVCPPCPRSMCCCSTAARSARRCGAPACWSRCAWTCTSCGVWPCSCATSPRCGGAGSACCMTGCISMLHDRLHQQAYNGSTAAGLLLPTWLLCAVPACKHYASNWVCLLNLRLMLPPLCAPRAGAVRLGGHHRCLGLPLPG